MFQKILIKSGSSQNEKGLNISNLVDMMFYYGEVHVMMSNLELRQLLGAFGEDVLYQLISNHLLILHPCDQHAGVLVSQNGVNMVDVFHNKDITSIDTLLYQYHRQIVHDSVMNVAFADRFSKVLEMYKYPKLVSESIVADISNDEMLSNLVRAFLRQYYPQYLDIEKVEIHAESVASEINGLFRMESNLNMDELNRIHKNQGYEKEFSYKTLLVGIGETAQDCYLTSELSSDIITNNRWSEMYKLRMNLAINRSVHSQENINRFQELTTMDYFSPGSAFAAGQLSPQETLNRLTLKDSIRFKEWLLQLPIDANLSNKMMEVALESNMQKWPIRTGRMAIPLIGGLINAGLGIILTGLDFFLGDKIGKEWSPTVFVNNVLKDNRLKK